MCFTLTLCHVYFMLWYLLDHSFFEIVGNRLETSIVELKAIVN